MSSGRRWMRAALALLVVAGAVGCGSQTAGAPQDPSPSAATSDTAASGTAASGTAASSTAAPATTSAVPSAVSPSVSRAPWLALRVAVPRGAPLDEEQLVDALSGVVGGVDGLPDRVRDLPDLWTASTGSAVTVTIPLPGTTAAQRDAVRRVLVGRWVFSLRPVVSSTVDPRACAALTTRPRVDRVCDPGTQEVLVLGEPLDVRADGVRVDTVQGGPAVVIALTAATRPVLQRWTAAHLGEQLAITDGRALVAAPTVQAPITTPELLVQGSFSPRAAAALAGRLQLAVAGAVVTAVG